MDGFSNRLKKIRENKKMKDPKWTQEYVADAIGVARSTYTAYENGTKQPPLETVNKIADLFETNVDYLLGRTDDPTPPGDRNKPYYALTEKDERDIARDLERMMSDLESNEAMAFYGEPMDEETKRLIRLSLEHSMRLAKEVAKKKYTPKKYRGNSGEGHD